MASPNAPLHDAAVLQQAAVEEFSLHFYASQNVLLIRYKRPMDLGFRNIVLPIGILQGAIAEITWRSVRQAMQLPPQQILIEWKP